MIRSSRLNVLRAHVDRHHSHDVVEESGNFARDDLEVVSWIRGVCDRISKRVARASKPDAALEGRAKRSVIPLVGEWRVDHFADVALSVGDRFLTEV